MLLCNVRPGDWSVREAESGAGDGWAGALLRQRTELQHARLRVRADDQHQRVRPERVQQDAHLGRHLQILAQPDAVLHK